MDNKESIPAFSEHHFLRDAIEHDTARKEYDEWICETAQELIDDYGTWGFIDVGGGKENARFYALNYQDNWKIGVYLLERDQSGRAEGVRLNLTEHNEGDVMTRVVTLARINFPSQRVTDRNGQELSIEDLGNVLTTLTRMRVEAEHR